MLRTARRIGPRALMALLGCACANGCTNNESTPPAPEPEVEPTMHPAWRRTRVVTADPEASNLTVLDIEFDEIVGELDADGPVRSLQVTGSGTHVLVAEGDKGQLLYPGISILDHSEGASDADEPHIHIYKFDPGWVEYPLPELGLGFVASVGGEVALYFDGTDDAQATVTYFDEQWLNTEPVPAPKSFQVAHGGPHVVAPVAQQQLLVAPGEAGEGALELMTAEGQTLDSFPCEGARGVSTHDRRVVVGCDEQLWVFRRDGASVSANAVALPGVQSRAIATQVDGDVAVVSGEANDLWKVDLASGSVEQISLPATACDVEIDSAYGEWIVVLAEDGSLHRLEAADPKAPVSLSVLPPFSCAAEVRPHLAMAPARAYVSAPDERNLLEVMIRTMEVHRTYAVPSRPVLVEVAGIDEKTRNLGDISDLE